MPGPEKSNKNQSNTEKMNIPALLWFIASPEGSISMIPVFCGSCQPALRRRISFPAFSSRESGIRRWRIMRMTW